ncbi:hypothetical protein PITCH_A2050023 [uncultured Desulfobacterium sp.]|uniref:Photosynthesis system II assembly factor Ycf48/Hcf136-like domain-containing protein n=1 Tax=uncultured Desulfobacterium sp. TaxID=201089 RepID=A0A445MXE0_9BACT|nr:hypothetical protein PITCH_A2050023 [uncultured Desulfobacterium sp.]
MFCVAEEKNRFYTKDNTSFCSWRLLIRHYYLILISILLLNTFLWSMCISSGQADSQLARRDKAFSINFRDNKYGWIVGDNGLALRTEDGGGSWQRVSMSEDYTFNDVYFVGKKGWIVGGGGVILHTDDSGITWSTQSATGGGPPTLEISTGADRTCPVVEPSSALRQTLMKVFFIDQDKGITVGADGTILRTEDGGINWINVSPNLLEILPAELIDRGVTSVNLYDVLFLNETSGWVVGDWGTILCTADEGKTWKVSHIGHFPPLFSISFKNLKEGWTVGQNGFALKTDNGGDTWTKFSIDTENSLYRIQVKEDYGVIVGDQAITFESNDGGKTWRSINSNLQPPYPWFVDVCLLPSNSARIVTVGKGIIKDTKIGSNQ